MRAPDAAELLAVWERGERQRPSQRVMAMLRAAAPDAPPDALLALPVGEGEQQLLRLRRELFGEHFSAVTSCPSCGEAIEVEFDFDDVGGTDKSVRSTRYRVPTVGDLIAVEGAADVETARVALLRRCAGDGEDAADVAAELAAADPQADVTLPVECPSCGDAWREPFDAASFLWTEIAAAARRLLSEVHVLASAYGWSERDILALSPARRHAYLEMVPWPTI